MKSLLNSSELSTFFEQLSIILRSGISALEGISIMRDDSQSSEGQAVLDAIYEQLEMTGCLYESLKETGVFPDYAVNMIEIGEKAGQLDEVTLSLSEYYEREDSIAASIKSAVTYPLVMLGMMLIVILVLILKVLPVFEQVFEQLGISMTGFSAAILKAGDTIRTYSVIFLVITLFIALIILYISKSDKGRAGFLSFVQKFGPAGKLSEKIARARFAGAMSLTLQSGLDTEESMEMIARLTEHPAIQSKIIAAQKMLDEGADFSEAFSSSGIFTGLYSKMAAVGYRAGALDEVMNRIAHQYEDEIDADIRKMIGFIEPTMVAVMSIIVGLILLSVMLPLTGIMAGIG